MLSYIILPPNQPVYNVRLSQLSSLKLSGLAAASGGWMMNEPMFLEPSIPLDQENFIEIIL